MLIKNLFKGAIAFSGGFKGVVLKPYKWSYKEQTWVSRAVLSTDYDCVSLFSKKNPGIYHSKLAKKLIKSYIYA